MPYAFDVPLSPQYSGIPLDRNCMCLRGGPENYFYIEDDNALIQYCDFSWSTIQKELEPANNGPHSWLIISIKQIEIICEGFLQSKVGKTHICMPPSLAMSLSARALKGFYNG